jgi:hypothetical protein
MTPQPLYGLGLPENLIRRLLAAGLYTPGHIITLIDDFPDAAPAVSGVAATELEQIYETVAGALPRRHLRGLGHWPERPAGGLCAQLAPDASGGPLAAFPNHDELQEWSAGIAPLPKSFSLAPEMPAVGDQGPHPFCGGFAAIAGYDQLLGSGHSGGYVYRGAQTREISSGEGIFLVDAMRHVSCTGVVREVDYSHADAVANRPVAEVERLAMPRRAAGFCSLMPGAGQSFDWVPILIKAGVFGTLRDGLPGMALPFGMQLFESFQSVTTSQTGLVSAPMPSERSLGGHAMAVTGWYDADAAENPFGIPLIEVRNSYSPLWAASNPMKHPGYALIPEALFTRPDLLWEIYLCLPPNKLRTR